MVLELNNFTVDQVSLVRLPPVAHKVVIGHVLFTIGHVEHVLLVP